MKRTIKLSEAVMDCPRCSTILFKEDLKPYLKHDGTYGIAGVKCPVCGRFTPLMEVNY